MTEAPQHIHTTANCGHKKKYVVVQQPRMRGCDFLYVSDADREYRLNSAETAALRCLICKYPAYQHVEVLGVGLFCQVCIDDEIIAHGESPEKANGKMLADLGIIKRYAGIDVETD